ncbi:unnamed protein product [Adineta ricciae]|uniref:adenylate kinase n=1 Tax=Adineta ricciae TaxID=249248 RepID=A0A815BCQ7_ADIRI|nr:unnamed protein product [Adineta ricciae]
MTCTHGNANTELAKEYISKRKIPQLFEALITGLMVHKPEDHLEFIINSLKRYKDGNQQLKWDEFIERKGGMHNILAPITKSTDLNTAPEIDNRPPKLDAIPAGKHEEKPKIQERPQSPTPDQQLKHEQERAQAPKFDQQHTSNDDKAKHQPQQTTNAQVTEHKRSLQGKPIVFVGGGPGSGKGTQCEKMIEKYGFTHLSAGDLIRAAVKDSTSEKGRYFNEIMSQGKLISTEDILGLLKDVIYERANQASGFLIDGFPRRVDQGIQFEKDVAVCDLFIYFDVPDNVMIERLLKRGETSGRVDDNQETIAKRLHTFNEETTPILDYYSKQGKLVKIDANRKPDEVFTDVSKASDRLLSHYQTNDHSHSSNKGTSICILNTLLIPKSVP